MIVQQEETEFAERLDCTDSIIMMKKSVNSYFKVSFFYSSDHDIILKKNIIMKRVETVKTLVPLECQGIINQSHLGRYGRSTSNRRTAKIGW